MKIANTISTIKITEPIFLIGFMGSGKTHWGSRLANLFHRNFIDLDQFIESNEQLTVLEIFEKKGENYFREKEAIALRSLIDEHNILVSCGGGTPCFHDNMNFMNQTGMTVFLEASPAFLLQNIIREPQARPLLNDMNESEMLYFVEKKLEERKEFYYQAKMILNAEELDETAIKNL